MVDVIVDLGWVIARAAWPKLGLGWSEASSPIYPADTDAASKANARNRIEPSDRRTAAVMGRISVKVWANRRIRSRLAECRGLCRAQRSKKKYRSRLAAILAGYGRSG